MSSLSVLISEDVSRSADFKQRGENAVNCWIVSNEFIFWVWGTSPSGLCQPLARESFGFWRVDMWVALIISGFPHQYV